MEKDLWQLEIAAPVANRDLIQGLLGINAQYGWEEKEDTDKICFNVYSEQKDLLEQTAAEVQSAGEGIKTLISAAQNREWQSAWKEFFTPVEAGSRFVILPPWLAHLEHTRRQEIIIEPKNAFGTGHHASTVLCLVALGELLDQKRIGKNDWFLDLGCGTGILGIAACKAGLRGTGLDIDPVAITNSRENRELNEAESLELLNGGIEKIGNEKYDLVMANILAQPLIELSSRITRAMEKKGCLILGGFLDSQVDTVAKAYMDCGLSEPRMLARDEWRTLVWE